MPAERESASMRDEAASPGAEGLRDSREFVRGSPVQMTHLDQGVRGAEANAPQPLRMCPSGAAFGRAQCSIPPV